MKKLIYLMLPLICLIYYYCKANTPLNILLITVDTLRADALNCYNKDSIPTPNIDSLTINGTIFKQAITPVPITLPAHASIMSCTYPSFHQVHHNSIYKLSNSLHTLAEILKQNGFKTAAFIGAFPLSSKFNINQGFSFYDEQFDEKKINEYFFAERRAEKVLDSAYKWIINNKATKWFVWIHLFDPHQPYNPPYPYNEIYKKNLYLGEVAYIDASLGNFFNSLKKEKILNNLFIVFTSDHGEAFGEHNEINHSTFIYETTLHIPLIIKTKDHLFQNKIINTQVSLVDIMPTILDYFHIKIPNFCQGKSLIPIIKKENNSLTPIYLETYAPFLDYNWSALLGWRKYPWKYIKAPKEELYKLDIDPKENINLIHIYPKIAKEMSKELAIFLSHQPYNKEEFSSLNSKELEKLAALGYIAFSKRNSSFMKIFNNKDPKDFALIAKEISLLNTSNMPLPALIGKYYKLLEMDSENPLINFRLAYCLYKNKEYNKSELIFQNLLNHGNQSADIYLGYAASLLQQGKIESAFKILKEAINKNYANEQIYYNLAEIYYFQGNLEEAKNNYALALKINPEFKAAINRIKEIQRKTNFK